MPLSTPRVLRAWPSISVAPTARASASARWRAYGVVEPAREHQDLGEPGQRSCAGLRGGSCGIRAMAVW